MPIAKGNSTGGYDAVDYIVSNGKTIRQIILGNGKPKNQLRLEDCKYRYFGADRSKEQWVPFHFTTQQNIMNNMATANVYDTGYYSSDSLSLKRGDLLGYSYQYIGNLTHATSTTLFKLSCGSSATNKSELKFTYATNPIPTLYCYQTDPDGTEQLLWSYHIWVETAVNLSVNVYATNSYLYKNPNIIPKLYIDIIATWKRAADTTDRTQAHIAHNCINDNGKCTFLSTFFSERKKPTDCVMTWAAIKEFTYDDVSRANVFVNS